MCLLSACPLFLCTPLCRVSSVSGLCLLRVCSHCPPSRRSSPPRLFRWPLSSRASAGPPGLALFSFPPSRLVLLACSLPGLRFCLSSQWLCFVPLPSVLPPSGSGPSPPLCFPPSLLCPSWSLSSIFRLLRLAGSLLQPVPIFRGSPAFSLLRLPSSRPPSALPGDLAPFRSFLLSILFSRPFTSTFVSHRHRPASLILLSV